ncbi:MAG: DUF72 domain-containing protein [Chitinivibrionales bacterium]|nr:DUF72 domain-containing protein [Chitinivibrionales bacterium]
MGTSGYYYDDWIGIFNPPKLTAAQAAAASDQQKADQDRLRFYQHYFSFVEINNTFYQPPSMAHFLDMEKRSKESMLYSVKVHKDISHTKTDDATAGKDLMQKHIYAVSPLIETGRFFSFLIQLEDHVYRSQKKLDYLLAVAAEAVAMRIDVHIEFRHISWHNADVLQALKNSGVGICNTEIPAVEHAFPLKAYATSDKGYVRYSGRNVEAWYPKSKPTTAKEKLAARNARYDYGYSEKELEEHTAGQLSLHKKCAAVAIAYNNHYQAKAVKNSIKNIEMLKSRLGVG